MRRPTTAHLVALALTVGALLWVAALIVATTEQRGILRGIVYSFASAICHQRPERSFTPSGHQFPVCARCAGLYVPGAFAAMAAWGGARRAPKHSRRLLAIAAAPTVATVCIEWLGLSDLSNEIRAGAALPFGAAAGWTFVRALRSEDARPDAL